MDARGIAALVVLLLASSLLSCPASGSGRRSLEGDKPSSGEDAPAPAVSAGGSPKHDSSKEPGQSSATGQEAEGHRHQNSPPPAASPLKDTTDSHKASPPPGGPGPNGGTNPEDTGSQAKEETDKMKEVMEQCGASYKCSAGKEFSACLQVSDKAPVGSFVIVHNEGQNEINVTVKGLSNTNIDKQSLHLTKGTFGQIKIKHINLDGWNITLSGGNENCSIHGKQSVEKQSVFDLQQQLQMFADALRLNPMYGASFFVFTVVLVGIVCVCCKFTKRRGSNGVPYQQLEMGSQAPNSAVVDNTTSTTDGWEDGWDDDWDDEEAPARPSDKKPTSSVSANGLSLRSQTNSKDGWDVDWDD
nr:unnamed protein product [Digitaria exilis]